MIYISKDKPSKIYAKVWKVDKKENYTTLQISTSDKQQDDTYKNSNWNCRVVGKAKDIEVNEGDRIVIDSAKVENVWDKKNKKNWLNIIVFSFETEGQQDNPFVESDNSDDMLPF